MILGVDMYWYCFVLYGMLVDLVCCRLGVLEVGWYE